ncbi:MAG: rRNA maturation RNase YbeY [Bacillota bacterium]|jgi:probable rRNA maturation factor|nr:rRNA maturation RNase YbeY [Bacillota bacterium]NLP22704.1 rRNA maturation RNase YbeY [Erysipelotrichaceae bacterium]
MSVTIFNKTKGSNLKEYYKDIYLLFDETLKKLNIEKDYDVSVILVRSKKIQEINYEFRNINNPTDVISFAMLDDEIVNVEESNDLGDIYINVDSVVSQAKEYGHSIRREFCFLFLHGLLHCLGYDHINEEDEKVMFSLQKEILDPVVLR